MNRTIYIRDDDASIWERARELAGDKLSPIIVEGLKRFVAAKEAESKGFQRIVVEFRDAHDSSLPKTKAFYGRWLISPQEPLSVVNEAGGEQDVYAIAETAKGNVVVTKYSEDDVTGRTALTFLVYSSFSDAAAELQVTYPIARAMEIRGVPVEELDI